MSRRVDGGLTVSTTSRYEAMSDETFDGHARALEAELRSLGDGDRVREIYDTKVLPCEKERVRRAAVRRHKGLADDAGASEDFDLLFVPVGDQPSSPTLAALATVARFYVFLHTGATRKHAEAAIEELGLTPAEAVLQSIGDGKSAPLMYQQIFDLIRDRPGARVAVDITGGLKTMSASAAAAAFAVPGARLFYVDADQHEIAGKKVWLNERRLELANPYVVFGELRRRTARELLRGRSYARAALAYQELDLDESDRLRAKLAMAYDAIDRLAFQEAESALAQLVERIGRIGMHPDHRHDSVVAQRLRLGDNLDGVRRLRRVVEQQRDPTSEETLDLGAMLIESAKRRLEEGLVDIAALLAYRVLELVPQRRLAVRGGIDPGAVVWETLLGKAGKSASELVEAFNRETRSPEHRLVADALPHELARARAYQLLRVAFPDDVASTMPTDRFAGLGDSRNKSVLAHGLSKLVPTTAKSMLNEAERLFARVLEVEEFTKEAQEKLWSRHRFISVED